MDRTEEAPPGCDVVVVGAGPAGMAAANLCARSGLATVLLEAAAQPGGRALGAETWNRQGVIASFEKSGAIFMAGTRLAHVSPDLGLTVQADEGERLLHARSVIIATGAIERPVRIPPGALRLGEAYANFAAHGTLPPGRVVIAGSGFLAWSTAVEWKRAGANVVGLLDTSPATNRRRALRSLAGFAFSPRRWTWLRTMVAARHAIPHVARVPAEGRDAAAAALGAETLVVHEGLVPDTELARHAGVKHRWDEEYARWLPLIDRNGGTSMAGVLVTGDAAGLAGAQAAAWSGVITATAVIHAIDPARKKLPVEPLARTAFAQQSRGREFLDAWHRPDPLFLTAAGLP
jgi:NADPH-dependent 2,4-dienoyl-CoA reductase/sulfur reductase-like enzyme